MKKIAVFCGANPGIDPIYASAAKGLAEVMAAQKMELVYGAGSVGLMGIIADRMLELGQPVLGVITQRLMDREVGHVGITDLRIVSTMHERKMLMADLADAFIAMPGGVGTLEEIVEAITWNQLGIHQKPCGFLNIAGYYNQLLGFLDHAVAQQFLKVDHRSALCVDENPARLIEKLKSGVGDFSPKWY